VIDRLAGLDILEFGGFNHGSMIPKSMSSTRSGIVEVFGKDHAQIKKASAARRYRAARVPKRTTGYC
jgi:hypothetical protein